MDYVDKSTSTNDDCDDFPVTDGESAFEEDVSVFIAESQSDVSVEVVTVSEKEEDVTGNVVVSAEARRQNSHVLATSAGFTAWLSSFSKPEVSRPAATPEPVITLTTTTQYATVNQSAATQPAITTQTAVAHQHVVTIPFVVAIQRAVATQHAAIVQPAVVQ
jgi:hypothetical protein